MPGATMRAIPNCEDCCNCKDSDKQKDGYKCSCQCKCFGFFQYKEWEHDSEQDLPTHFAPKSIKILYRDRIRVFYGTVNQAKNDGYTDFSESIFSNKNGFVYSYTGLRGDAKFLYKQVKRGDEKRVELVKTPTPDD